MTARELIMKGRENYNFYNVINELTEDDILNLMEEYANIKRKEILMGFLDFEKKPMSFPPQYKFLEDRFTYDSKDRTFKSKRKRLGAGTGDDSSLFLSVDSGGTLIWWRSNRGHEDIIFDGKELKTEQEFNQVFELLELKTLLKWE